MDRLMDREVRRVTPPIMATAMQRDSHATPVIMVMCDDGKCGGIYPNVDRAIEYIEDWLLHAGIDVLRQPPEWLNETTCDTRILVRFKDNKTGRYLKEKYILHRTHFRT